MNIIFLRQSIYCDFGWRLFNKFLLLLRVANNHRGKDEKVFFIIPFNMLLPDFHFM